MAENTFKLREIRPEDHKIVTDLIIEYYYGDEPIFSSKPKLIPGPRDLADVAECLNSGTSVMCYRETTEGEELLAATLATIKDRSYVDKFNDTAAQEGNTKYGQYVRMLASMHGDVNICDRYGVDRFLYCFMCCVGRKSRGNKLAHRMAVASMTLAKRKGLKVWVADASSFYSAAVFDSMKMDRVNTLLHTDYVDEHKMPYFVKYSIIKKKLQQTVVRGLRPRTVPAGCVRDTAIKFNVEYAIR